MTTSQIDELLTVVKISVDQVNLPTVEGVREERHLSVELTDKVVRFPFGWNFPITGFLRGSKEVLQSSQFKVFTNEPEKPEFKIYGDSYICFYCEDYIEDLGLLEDDWVTKYVYHKSFGHLKKNSNSILESHQPSTKKQSQGPANVIKSNEEGTTIKKNKRANDIVLMIVIMFVGIMIFVGISNLIWSILPGIVKGFLSFIIFTVVILFLINISSKN